MKATLKMNNIADVLGDIIFEFNSGKLTLITGPNGSGKTKIINSIAAVESFPIQSENLKKQAIKLIRKIGIWEKGSAEWIDFFDVNERELNPR